MCLINVLVLQIVNCIKYVLPKMWKEGTEELKKRRETNLWREIWYLKYEIGKNIKI
jgi:hypothetical protein